MASPTGAASVRAGGGSAAAEPVVKRAYGVGRSMVLRAMLSEPQLAPSPEHGPQAARQALARPVHKRANLTAW